MSICRLAHRERTRFERRRFGTVPSGHLGRIGLDLMATIPFAAAALPKVI
jgi:hypothetical protein